MIVYLRFTGAYLSESIRFESKKAAIEFYTDTMRDLERIGQRIGATLHVGQSLEELNERPDFFFDVGPRGGIVCVKLE